MISLACCSRLLRSRNANRDVDHERQNQERGQHLDRGEAAFVAQGHCRGQRAEGRGQKKNLSLALSPTPRSASVSCFCRLPLPSALCLLDSPRPNVPSDEVAVRSFAHRFLHVGGARTAIFNLLHGRRFGGRMLLRIECTVVERSKQHHAEQIVSSLQWLGIEWDEGPIYQSDRLERYRERAEELVANGKAYRCYCTVEELDAVRAAAEHGGDAYRYSGRCRMRAEAGQPQPDDVAHVIRCKVYARSDRVP